MAILCQQHGLLFIQAPRTGCTAIEQLLLERFGGRSVPPENILDKDGFVSVQRKHCTVPQLLREGLVHPRPPLSPGLAAPRRAAAPSLP